MSKHPLNVQMNEIAEYIINALKHNADGGDAHRQTCIDTADHYNLWEIDKHGAKFPMWLSYVVQGIGRDEGILD